MNQTVNPDVAILINPYELGRQPFTTAQLASWLEHQGYQVRCVELALQRLDDTSMHDARLVAISLPMHTATRIALEALPRVRQLAPHAEVCVHGLYAPMNADLFHAHGVHFIFGGEAEPLVSELAANLSAGRTPEPKTEINLSKIDFRKPARDAMAHNDRYAKLLMPDSTERTVAFTEASRGCKHLCRHCPVVPVYQGKFRAVPRDIVLDDIDQQLARGASHVSFGDPDFFNGPTHALRIVRELHRRHPSVTYDATIKIEHLLANRESLGELKRTGCLFVTSAVESLDDRVLDKLEKGHTAADFEAALWAMREVELALAPTFVAFTPWTSLEGYRYTLQRLGELTLINSVPPIQLAIRLLIPAGSRILELTDVAAQIGSYDDVLLGHPWKHADSRVDDLQKILMAGAERAQEADWSREKFFEFAWQQTEAALALDPKPRVAGDEAYNRPYPGWDAGPIIAQHSEAWYCCAEPTQQQLNSF